MKTCTRCQIPQALSEYETPRKRICNTCAEIMEQAKRNRVPPPQKLTNEEFTANYLKTKSVTVVPNKKTTYSAGKNLMNTGDPIRRNENGDRLYRFLNRNTNGSIDETTKDYGQ